MCCGPLSWGQSTVKPWLCAGDAQVAARLDPAGGFFGSDIGASPLWSYGSVWVPCWWVG